MSPLVVVVSFRGEGAERRQKLARARDERRVAGVRGERGEAPRVPRRRRAPLADLAAPLEGFPDAVPQRERARLGSQARRALHERAQAIGHRRRARHARVRLDHLRAERRQTLRQRRQRGGGGAHGRGLPLGAGAADQGREELRGRVRGVPSAALVAALRGGDERRDRGLKRVRQRVRAQAHGAVGDGGPVAPRDGRSKNALQETRRRGTQRSIADVRERDVAQLPSRGRAIRVVTEDAAQRLQARERAFAVSRVPRRAQLGVKRGDAPVRRVAGPHGRRVGRLRRRRRKRDSSRRAAREAPARGFGKRESGADNLIGRAVRRRERLRLGAARVDAA